MGGFDQVKQVFPYPIDDRTTAPKPIIAPMPAPLPGLSQRRSRHSQRRPDTGSQQIGERDRKIDRHSEQNKGQGLAHGREGLAQVEIP